MEEITQELQSDVAKARNINLNKRTNLYSSFITVNGIRYSLGTFINENEAVKETEDILKEIRDLCVKKSYNRIINSILSIVNSDENDKKTLLIHLHKRGFSVSRLAAFFGYSPNSIYVWFKEENVVLENHTNDKTFTDDFLISEIKIKLNEIMAAKEMQLNIYKNQLTKI